MTGPAHPRHEKLLLVRPEFLNHGGTLFGGYLMQWADDMAYIAASLAYPGADFVTKLFGPFDFRAPARAGDILRILSQVESTGVTSCRVPVWAVNAKTGAEIFRTFAVMVNVRDGAKAPLPKAGA
jgi:acyl-CoA hydrolase